MAASRRASAPRCTRRCRSTPAGQPLASTFADYLLPGATEVPEPRLDHMETPSPYTEFGVKGIGEGGAIAPPAAIANAVNDALKGLGVETSAFADHAAPHRRGGAEARARQAGGMKPAPFRYARPADLDGVLALLAEEGAAAKIIAGGQSLGPMLNLRLVAAGPRHRHFRPRRVAAGRGWTPAASCSAPASPMPISRTAACPM